MNRRAAFTLVELMVAIGIIAVLGALTVISVRGIAKDARLASAQNSVVATLNRARAIAMKDNNYIAVAFHARWDTDNQRVRQQTEIVIARWTGVSEINQGNTFLEIVDRYEPIPGESFVALPAGIKVAGPWYDYPVTGGSPDLDNYWITQSEFREIVLVGEEPGRQFAVFYGPDGIVTTENPQSDAEKFYVDYNGDGNQDLSHGDPNYPPNRDSSDDWEYDHPLDENNLNPVPFLAVYDDDEARETKIGNWTGNQYSLALQRETGYINQFGKRFHFNRYTGVVMTAEEQ